MEVWKEDDEEVGIGCRKWQPSRVAVSPPCGLHHLRRRRQLLKGDTRGATDARRQKESERKAAREGWVLPHSAWRDVASG